MARPAVGRVGRAGAGAGKGVAAEIDEHAIEQIAVGAQDQVVAEILARLNAGQQVFAEDLLQRDSLPFWKLGNRRQQGENTSLYRTATSRWISIVWPKAMATCNSRKRMLPRPDSSSKI